MKTNSKSIKIDWNKLNATSDKNWANKDFILNQDLQPENFKMINKDIWLDEDFLFSFLQKENNLIKSINNIRQIDKEITNSIDFMKVVKKSLNKLIITENNLLENSIGQLWLKLYKYEAIENSGIGEKFVSVFIQDAEDVIKILNYETISIVKYLDPSIQCNHDLLKEIYDKVIVVAQLSGDTDENYFSFLPNEFFQDKNNMKFFLKNCLEEYNGELDSFLSLTNKKLWFSWIKDKEQVLEYVKQSNSAIYTTYEYLPTKLKTDIEVCSAYLNNNAKVYEYFDKSIRSLEDFGLQYLDKMGYSNYVPDKTVFKLKDNNKILQCLEKNAFLMESEHCPKEWRDNIDYLLLTPYLENVISKDKLNHLYENTNFMCKWVEKHMDEFKNLPPKVKENSEIVLTLLKKIKADIDENKHRPNGHQYSHANELLNNILKKELKNFPYSLWENESFFKEAINIEEKYLQLMPNNFWQEQSIVLNILSLVDNAHISEQNFKSNAPLEVIKFFDSIGIHENYASALKAGIINQNLDESLKTSKVLKEKIIKI